MPVKKTTRRAVASGSAPWPLAAALMTAACACSPAAAQALTQGASDGAATLQSVQSPASGADQAPLVADVPTAPNASAVADAVTAHVTGAPTHSELSLGYSTAHVTNDYGDWSGVRLRGLHQFGNQTLIGEVSEIRRFGQRTTFGAATYVRDFNADWFGC